MKMNKNKVNARMEKKIGNIFVFAIDIFIILLITIGIFITNNKGNKIKVSNYDYSSSSNDTATTTTTDTNTDKDKDKKTTKTKTTKKTTNSNKKSNKQTDTTTSISITTTTTTATENTTTTVEETSINDYEDYNNTETYYGEYSPYDLQTMGVIYYGGYRYTYYSENVLPGGGLAIEGRHTDEYGFVCDGDGYMCVASGSLPWGSTVYTPFGRIAKVYDCGCDYDVIDCYVSW